MITIALCKMEKEVVSYRDHVPLIGITWSLEQENRAEKKSGSQILKIQPPEMAE